MGPWQSWLLFVPRLKGKGARAISDLGGGVIFKLYLLFSLSLFKSKAQAWVFLLIRSKLFLVWPVILAPSMGLFL